MAVGRWVPTATLLSDGRVLVTGGQGDSNIDLASAEIWDPGTGRFSSTGSMTTQRAGQTATLLADGRVLVTGGAADNGLCLTSAELYDPKTGTFSPTGPMGTGRCGYTATAIGDGRVLIAGGADNYAYGFALRASAELYDPKTGTFSPTGSMAVARTLQTATRLSDGRVLVAGGGTQSSGLASAELYDPKTGTFSPTGPTGTGRCGNTATAIGDGRVLVTGGDVSGFNLNSPFLASAEIYDSKTGVFSPAGP
jgi:WD40 repeat protein